MGSVIIETKNLSKHFGRKKAVDNVNITVRKGDIYGFLGRNGAGKTTTINMLLGLMKPTFGEIKIFGENVIKNNSVLERIGSASEFPGFYPNLTAVENLTINTKLIGVQKNNAIDEALEIVGILDDRNMMVKKFSLGMKQRLGIARAIIHNPELLILDEPTNGLDPIGIKQTRKLIKSLAEKRNITIFMSSHILSEVQQLATIIGVIHRVGLLEEISIEDLMKRNRKYIEIKVSNEAKAVVLLETKMDIYDYEVYEDKTIRIYTHHDRIAEINKFLVEEGIEVTKLNLSEDSLEDYFIKSTGGEEND